MTPPDQPARSDRPIRVNEIPGPTIKRLSLYLRYLEQCHARAERTISSKQLGETLNLTDAQVRKDLAYFGPFGHPGIGYRVHDLIHRIRQILGTDHTWKVALIGAGNLGRALAAYQGFFKKGFKLVAVFDADPTKVGQPLPASEGLNVLSVRDLAEVVEREGVKMGIVAVPASCAQEVADQMISAGIQGILNFAPVMLNVPPDVIVAGVDLAVQLEQLSFRVSGLFTQEPVRQAD